MELLLDVKRNGKTQSSFEEDFLAEVHKAMLKMCEDIPSGSEVCFNCKGGILLKCDDRLDVCEVEKTVFSLSAVTSVTRLVYEYEEDLCLTK